MEKTEFERPEMEIIYFEADDIIVTSSPGGDGDTPIEGWG